MARQWETQADLDRETAVARLYAELRNCEHEKLPVQYKADYAFLRDGELKALVEIRCRNVRHDTYDTIMLSLLKWHDVNAMAKAIDVPAMFVVRYTDGIYTIPLRETPDEITMGGRALMRDARDREPVVHYRVDRMRRVADVSA
jgi:hypothetical protein